MLVLAIQFLRRPDWFTSPQFWAEDGLIYFRQQEIYGFLACIFRPYAGYFQLLPRLIAGFAALFPLVEWPLVYNLSGVLICSACLSVFSVPAFRVIIESQLIRAAMCIVAASAFYSGELVGTSVNSIWYLFVPAALILVWPDTEFRRKGFVAAGSCFMVIAVLSDPQLIVLLPLMLVHLVRTKGRRRLVPLSYLLGLVIQAIPVLMHPQGAAPWPGTFVGRLNDLIAGVILPFFHRAIVGGIAGEAFAMRLASSGYTGILILGLMGAAIALAALALVLRNAQRRYFAAALFMAAASLSLPIVIRHQAPVRPGSLDLLIWGGERHLLLSYFVVVFILGLGIDRLLPSRSKLAAPLVLCLVFAGGIRENFSIARFADLDWPAYASDVERWNQSARTDRPAIGVTVPVNPGGWFPIVFPNRFDYVDISTAPTGVEGTVCRHSNCEAIPHEWDIDAHLSSSPSYIELGNFSPGWGFDVGVLCTNRSTTPELVSVAIHGVAAAPGGGASKLLAPKASDWVQLRYHADQTGKICIHITGRGPDTIEVRKVQLRAAPGQEGLYHFLD